MRGSAEALTGNWLLATDNCLAMNLPRSSRKKAFAYRFIVDCPREAKMVRLAANWASGNYSQTVLSDGSFRGARPLRETFSWLVVVDL